MGSIYCAAPVDVPADVAWDYLDRFTRAEVLPFSSSAAGRRDGEYRVITMPGGQEIRERIVTVDPARRRTSYTIAGLNGAEHHHAEMRVDVDSNGTVTLVWVTDYLPHEVAEQRAAGYAALFAELVAAVNAHKLPDRDRQRLGLEELLEPRLAHLPADAGLLEPAEGHVGTEPGAAVDADGAGPDPARDREGTVAVAAEHRARQAVDRVVGDPHRVVVAVVRDDHQHRPEDLLLGDLAVRATLVSSVGR